MTNLNVSVPIANQPNATEDPKIITTFTNLSTWANGNIDTNNLSPSAAITAAQIAAALAQSASVNQAGQTVKGTVNISTSQSTTSTTYTTLATPDQVTGVVLPTNGLIAVWYQATWQTSSGGLGNAAIFLGSNQVQIPGAGASPSVQSAAAPSNAATNNILYMTNQGLANSNSATAYTGDVTTGQILGTANVTGGQAGQAPGPCLIKATAGTYSVSIQFKTTSGQSVTAVNRQLWVQAFSFA